MSHPVAPLDQPAFWRAGAGGQPLPTNSPQFALLSAQTKCLQNQHFSTVVASFPQRLLKTLNRDDLEVVGILPRVLGVLARRDEEVIHILPAHPIVFC